MKIYTVSQARRNLSEVLNKAQSEEVFIRRRGGQVFRVAPKTPKGSPFDVPGVKTGATTTDILAAIQEVRAWPRPHFPAGRRPARGGKGK